MVEEVRSRLFEMQDTAYRDFQAKLMPTVDPRRIIGVRTPALRAYARGIRNTDAAVVFLADLPHGYYEEDNLHAFLIEFMRDCGECIAALDNFLPYMDNWATCDCTSPRVFKKHLPELRQQVRKWMASEHVYTIRFGIGMLMKFFMDEAFEPVVLAEVAALRSEEYYVKMMIAWFFATALAKQWEAALPYIENHRLDAWTHAKAIQKAVESCRISAEQKDYLKKFRNSGRTGSYSVEDVHKL